MMKKLYIIILAIIAYSCEEKVLEPVNQSGTVPGEIVVEEVENLNGAVEVTYSLPPNSDLLYTLAKYKTARKDFETKTSIYSSSVLLEGFFEEKEYEVSLVGVNRAGQQGEEVKVKVNPLKSPAVIAMESMDIIPGFGGAFYVWENELKAPLTVNVLFEDSLGMVRPYDWVETDAPKQSYAIRGLDTIPKKFVVYITDKFFNKTDSLVKTITPLFEEELSVDGNNAIILPGDAEEESWSGGVNTLFDDKYGWRESIALKTPEDGKPKMTFDLGQPTKISRVWFKNRVESPYGQGNIEKLKIFGLNELPATAEEQADMANWEEIGEYHMTPPSGNPNSSYTEGDKAYFLAGVDLSFEISTPKYRYVRFQFLKNYKNTSYWYFTEMKFYGVNE